MAEHLYGRVVRYCETCDAEQMVTVETVVYASDFTAEMWDCRCGENHHNEFTEGEDN